MAWLGRFDDFNHEPQNCGTFRKNDANKFGYRSSSNNLSKCTPAVVKREEYAHICDISSNINHVSLIGLIIAKDGPKSVVSKRGTGNERHLVAFTVRDSESAFINLTCWGGEQYVKMIASELQIGDVVDIKGAQVQNKSNNPADEKFKPWTPSSCHLTTGENQGTIVPYSGLDIEDYACLMQNPTRPSNDFYTLEDIQANGIGLQGENINILAVVKQIYPPKKVVLKSGKSTTKQDVVLCDETCMSFSLTLWDNYVSLAENWIAMDTDVRIMYNDYRSAMTASTGSKTIITINPDTPEAACIKEYSKTQVSFLPNENTGAGNVFADDRKDPPLETITNVLRICDAKHIMNNESGTTYGLLYAFLSYFDIDGDERSLFREICSGCHKFVQESTGYVCENPNCRGGDLKLDGIPEVEYSLAIGLSDHTGSLNQCYVPPNVVEQILGAKAQEFRGMHGLHKTSVKWSFLLERVKAVVKIRSGQSQRSVVKVLSLDKASLEELVLPISN